MEGLLELAVWPEMDVLVTAIVGMIGIKPTIAAIQLLFLTISSVWVPIEPVEPNIPIFFIQNLLKRVSKAIQENRPWAQ